MYNPDLLYTNEYLPKNKFNSNDKSKTKNINTNLIDKRQYKDTASNLKNKLPILSDELNDLVENRYDKDEITYVNIDSNYRDDFKNTQPNNYTITLGKLFYNIIEIDLIGINFANIFQPITHLNNTIQWAYPFVNEIDCNYNINNIDGNDDINIYDIDGYSLIQGSQQIEHVATICPGNYSLQTLALAMEQSMNSVAHNTREEYGYLYGYNNNLNIIEKIGKMHNFRVTVNENNKNINIINRLEELPISYIGTIINSINIPISPTLLKNRIIFQISFDIKSSYLGEPLTGINGSINNSHGMYVIPTDFPSIGYIDERFINNVPYRIVNEDMPNYLELISTEPCIEFISDINQYKDAIILQTYTPLELQLFSQDILSKKYYTYALYCFKKHNKLYIPMEYKLPEIYPLLTTQFPFNAKLHDRHYPKIGRALLFEFIYDSNSISNTLLHAIGLHINSPKNTYSLIHSNNIYDNSIKSILMKGNNILLGDNYFFIKLIVPYRNTDIFNISMIKADSNSDIRDASTDITKIFSKSTFTDIPGNMVNIEKITRAIYDEPIDNIDSLTIQFIDKNGEYLKIMGEHSFVLKIIQKKMILKDTHINSQYGDISVIGY